jgi:hypothetical protein
LARFLSGKDGDEEPEHEGVLLPLLEVSPVAQASWPGFTGSGALLTVGMSSLCFVHCIIEIRIAGKTQSAGRPSTKFAGSCPALAEEGVSEIHTFLFDVMLTYVCRREVFPRENNPRLKLECLSDGD